MLFCTPAVHVAIIVAAIVDISMNEAAAHQHFSLSLNGLFANFFYEKLRYLYIICFAVDFFSRDIVTFLLAPRIYQPFSIAHLRHFGAAVPVAQISKKVNISLHIYFAHL